MILPQVFGIPVYELAPLKEAVATSSQTGENQAAGMRRGID
jgi:hypothetical protein